MENQSLESDLVFLLHKYIENRCSEDELYTLLHWLKSSDSKDGFDLVGRSVWNHLNKKISYPEDKKMMMLNREVSYLLQRIRQKKTAASQKISVNPVKWLYGIAAAVLLIIIAGTGYYLVRSGETSVISNKEIVVSRGEIKEYTLDDGTHVVLNSGSKLTIPSDYNKDHREVEMTGEGFFDVIPNPEKPFIIKNGETRLKVLGTSFNLKSYEEDAFLALTVSTGKVLIDVPGMDIRLRVNPLEHLSIDKQAGTLTKLKLDENYYAGWTNGTLYFDKTPIGEVIRSINRKYNKTVILSGPDYDNLISGTHDNKNLDAIIESICFATGLEPNVKGDTIILSKSNLKTRMPME
jgi:ferric-dicitrate binding protein FerR (iron transport regulator)